MREVKPIERYEHYIDWQTILTILKRCVHWLIPLVTIGLVALALYIVTHRQINQGEAVLIAVLTGGAIAVGLMPKRKYQTTARVYVIRGPLGIVLRLKGDEETDNIYAEHWAKYDKGETQ
jgi:hypothetical protein